MASQLSVVRFQEDSLPLLDVNVHSRSNSVGKPPGAAGKSV